MKKLVFCTVMFLLYSNAGDAQITKIREMKQHRDLNLEKIDPAMIQFDQLDIGAATANVSISVEPKDGDYLLYHRTPGFNYFDAPKAQLSILALMHNKETKNVDLDKVVIEYQKGGQTISKSISLPANKQIVEPGYVRVWQNSRDYHETGDIVYLESPYPSQVKLKFYYKNYAIPVVVTKKLKAFNLGFALPFKTSDLKKDEYWSSYSMHGGGGQVFAYDMGVEAYVNNGWTDNLPNTDGTQNDDKRVWGKPIYAMADGKVLHSLNNCPNNPKPGQEADWSGFDYGGAGNHLYIKHGDYVALYAHMQKGTVNSNFLAKGSNVKKGDFLGYSGNAGSSSGPHLHIHLYTYKNDDEPEGGYYRPLMFNMGYVIGKDQYSKPMGNVNWSRMDNEGIPGLKGKSCFIWPSEKHPYCAYGSSLAEVAKHGVSENAFQQEFDKIWTCGYYPIWMDGYSVAGKTYYNAIFRPSDGVQWVARFGISGSQYQTEYNKWDKEGYNLLNVDSYIDNGQVRYAAVWKKDNRTIMAYHGQTLAWHESNFKKNSDAGWVPVNISCVTTGGQTYVTALWEKKNVGGFYARPVMSLQEYKDYFKDYSDKQGFKLVYLNGYTHNGQPRLSGIWYKTTPNYNSWQAKHHLTVDGYQNEFNSWTGQNYLTRVVTGYADGSTQRFEGIWSK